MVNLLDPLPYEAPEIEDLEVSEELISENQESEDSNDDENPATDEGQITLF